MGKLVSREVAAELLNVSVETVIRLARSGDLEEIRVSDRAVRVDADSIDRHIESRRRERRLEGNTAA